MQLQSTISARCAQDCRPEIGACLSSTKLGERGGSVAAAAAAAMTARAARAQEQRERWAAREEERRPGRPARLARVQSARGRTAPGRRYAATVSSPDRVLVIDSAIARVQRAQRRIHAWASIVPDEIEGRRRGKDTMSTPRLVMLTLTYADANGWQSNDIREYMQKIRKTLRGALIAYAWVLETQARGAPHYHVMLYVRRGTFIPTPDKSGQWGKGSSRIETARTPFYICKYIGKAHQKEMLPAGARMFAVWISDKIVGTDALLNLRQSSLPGWFRAIVQSARDAGIDVSSGWQRAPGGGWMMRCDGERHPSPWRLEHIEVLHGRTLDWG
jgi:hypothetical protein